MADPNRRIRRLGISSEGSTAPGNLRITISLIAKNNSSSNGFDHDLSLLRRGARKIGGCSDPVETIAVDGECLGRSRGGLSSKIHLAVDGRGLPMSVILTPGQGGDNPQLVPLLEKINVRRRGRGRLRSRPEAVIADKAYSHPSTRQSAAKAQSPVHQSREVRPDRAPETEGLRRRAPAFETTEYRKRNVVEHCFARLKQFRDLATRYAKRAAYYAAELTIAAITL